MHAPASHFALSQVLVVITAFPFQFWNCAYRTLGTSSTTPLQSSSTAFTVSACGSPGVQSPIQVPAAHDCVTVRAHAPIPQLIVRVILSILPSQSLSAPSQTSLGGTGQDGTQIWNWPQAAPS